MNNTFETPYFLLHQAKLEQNLQKLQNLEKQTGVKILHTLKSFNEPSVLPSIIQNLSGLSISSPKELQMAIEANARHIHLYAPAFSESTLNSMIDSVQTISFNSLSQWQKFKDVNSSVSKGLRLNPELSFDIPKHCNPNLSNSRLGVKVKEFVKLYHENQESFTNLKGLHIHALFQSSSYDLEILLNHIQNSCQSILSQLKWLNLGGGHDFTSYDYNVEHFGKVIKNFQSAYPNIQLYFEPGESVIKGCGEFVATVLDIIENDAQSIVILDTSIETHLLDVAIVNLQLKVQGTQKEPTPYPYTLTGNSCLQGDIIGEYFFTHKLEIGDKIFFEDMMAYSMVKMTEFNGMDRASFYLN
jgi:carboxynorspermidine decarboxylase